MNASADNLTLEKLQAIKYQLTSPIQLNFDGQTIQCIEMIRVVPGKRIVFLGRLSNSDSLSSEHSTENVIIKTFIHPSRAKKHWSREHSGADLLNNHQILTPDLIAYGLSEEGVFFLVFRFIKGQNLAAFWKESNTLEREQKLKILMPVLEKHHSSGLAHQDLHYANFLLGDDDAVYTLDGEEVKDYGASLTKKVRLKNLALFLAQTFDLTQASCLSLLNEYIAFTPFSLKAHEHTRFWLWIKEYQQARIDQYLKKILRECTEVVYDKKKRGYTLCRREYKSQAIQQLLAQPEHFFQNEDSAFLKQGNTCTVKSVIVDNKPYVIKRYNPKGVTYELKHKGQISRARKSWMNAHLLRFMGILTPEPVALIEQTPALGQRCSYFICQFQAGQSSWDFFCDETFCDEKLSDKTLYQEKTKVADKLIATLKQLCDYRITHGDLKGSNFLINDNQVWVLDLDALTQHQLNWRFKKNWQRDKRRFLKNWDKKDCYKPWKLYFNQTFL